MVDSNRLLTENWFLNRSKLPSFPVQLEADQLVLQEHRQLWAQHPAPGTFPTQIAKCPLWGLGVLLFFWERKLEKQRRLQEVKPEPTEPLWKSNIFPDRTLDIQIPDSPSVIKLPSLPVLRLVSQPETTCQHINPEAETVSVPAEVQLWSSWWIRLVWSFTAAQAAEGVFTDSTFALSFWLWFDQFSL